MACLRQLAQKEANEISEYARSLYDATSADGGTTSERNAVISESGLEGALFSLLDRESDRQLRKVGGGASGGGGYFV